MSTLSRQEIPPGADLWEQVQPAWRALLAATGEPSAFLSEIWIETWLETFAERMRTAALIWRDSEGQEIGCVLLSRGAGRFGPFRVSRSFLNASGAPEVGCDHNDVLALEGYRAEIIDDLARVVLGLGADEFALQGVRDTLFEEMRTRWPSRTWTGHGSESPYVDLAKVRASGEGYLAQLSSNTRSQIRRSIRLYEERSGEACVEIAGNPEEAVAWLDELVELHESTWQERGEAGAFRGEAREFHRALIRSTVPNSGRDELRSDIVRVRFGEETIALLYNTVYRGRVSFYQSGVRYADDRKLKPGLVAHVLAVDRYLASGEVEYDFLGGEPQPVQYKRSLSTDVRSLYWARLHAPSVKMGALGATRRVWRVVRGEGDDSS